MTDENKDLVKRENSGGMKRGTKIALVSVGVGYGVAKLGLISGIISGIAIPAIVVGGVVIWFGRGKIDKWLKKKGH